MANTAVAIVLVAVFTLAVVAVLASRKASRQQQFAEEAQEKARQELFHAKVSNARAARLSSTLDRRQESLRSVSDAASIQATDILRNEAIASLALSEFTLEQTWPLPEDAGTQAFDRELNRYAVGTESGEVILHRIADNQIIHRLRPADENVPEPLGGAIGLEFSPDGQQLAVRYQKGALAVWDLSTSKMVFRQAMDRARQPLSRPRFTSDGEFLIAMTLIPKEGVAVFRWRTGETVALFSQFKSFMHAAPRPGSSMFAINTETNAAVLVDWRSGQVVTHFPFPAGIQRMAWSADGKLLAISGNTVDVHLWDVETGQKRILIGHTTDVRHLAFSPDGEWLVSAAWDATSRLWETRTGRMIGVTEGFAEQFGDHGRLALSRFKGAVEIHAFRPSPVHRVYTGPGPADAPTWAMDLTPDGRWLFSVVPDKRLAIWDLERGSTPQMVEMPEVRLPALHPKSQELLVSKSREVFSHHFRIPTNAESYAIEWSEPARFPVPVDFSPQWLTFSANGQSVALGSFFEGKVFVSDWTHPENRVWMTNLAHLTRLEAQSPGAGRMGGGTLALSSDGNWLICGFVHPRGTKVWNARTGDSVASLSADNSIIAWSPDGQLVAAGSRALYQVFRTNDWKEVWRWQREGPLLGVGPCAFSPDGRELAVAKSAQLVAILDTSTGHEITELTAPRPATLKTLRWSSDGHRLVVGTMENLIHTWELNALHRELRALKLDWGASLTLSPSGAERILPSPIHPTRGTAGAIILGLFATGLVTAVALIALHRHRRLTEDFAHSEILSQRREQDLQVAQEVSRLKSTFVSMVSHEFRTPLAVITASTGNLQRYFERLSAEQRTQLLIDIGNASERMKDLIEEVLLLGKVESGKMRCQPTFLDLPALCERTISEVSKAFDQPNRIQLNTVDLEGRVELDETLISVILTNLLNNALKYSPPDSAVMLKLERNGNEIVLQVRDLGMGIPAEDQKELFKSFYRASNVGQTQGTGLGLTIVKRCVDLHGGHISFDSALHQGTTFTVCIPATPRTNSSPYSD